MLSLIFNIFIILFFAGYLAYNWHLFIKYFRD